VTTPDPKPAPGPVIRREQRTIRAMVDIYCHDHHGPGPVPCDQCTRLTDYALRRLEICPFQERKPACNHCQVHCYSARMRERLRTVMRYAGPRMPLRHPWLALMHLVDARREAPSLRSSRQGRGRSK